jgi:solute carrier family 25 citrate transporter 1
LLRDPVPGQLSTAHGVLAGSTAGCVESFLAVTPTERLKTALIDDACSVSPRFKNSFHAVRVLVREHGLKTLYRGLASTALKQSATSAVRMANYNFLRELSKTYGSGSGNSKRKSTDQRPVMIC